MTEDQTKLADKVMGVVWRKQEDYFDMFGCRPTRVRIPQTERIALQNALRKLCYDASFTHVMGMKIESGIIIEVYS